MKKIVKKRITTLIETFGTEQFAPKNQRNVSMNNCLKTLDYTMYINFCNYEHVCRLKKKLSRSDYEDFWNGVIASKPEVREVFDCAKQLKDFLVKENLINYNDLAEFFCKSYRIYNRYGAASDAPLSSLVYEGIFDLTEPWLEKFCGYKLESSGDDVKNLVKLYNTCSYNWYWEWLYEYCIMLTDLENKFTINTLNALQHLKAKSNTFNQNNKK